ncbi:MAG: hypothetical protein ABJL67_13145, partial [Sulfitobacter sp.]
AIPAKKQHNTHTAKPAIPTRLKVVIFATGRVKTTHDAHGHFKDNPRSLCTTALGWREQFDQRVVRFSVLYASTLSSS